MWETYATGHMTLFWAGVFGAFLTAIYTFRLIWLVFFGQAKTHAEPLSGLSYALPLGILIVLSTGLGAFIHPPLADVLPQSVGAALEQAGTAHGKHTAEYWAMGAMALGLLLAFGLYVVNQGRLLTHLKNSSVGGAVHYWCYHGLGFDALYDIVFVKPFLALVRFIKNDPVDKLWQVVPALAMLGNRLFGKLQNGLVNTQAASLAFGLAIVLVLAMKMVA